MEVHHPHHIPKKLKEYLTEFIMLFAAVTLGFVAENLREHQIENQRAKEFLELFRTEVVRNEKTIDSLMNAGLKPLQVNERLSFKLLTHQKISSIEIADSIDMFLFRFSNDKRIFELMKNSGSLRLIRDKQLVEDITSYEIEADMAEMRAFDQETSQWKELYHFIVENFPGEMTLRMFRNKIYSGIMKINPENPQLFEKYTPEIDSKIIQTVLDAKVKEKLGNYLGQKVTLEKLSFLNYLRVKKKTKPLLEKIDHYLESN